MAIVRVICRPLGQTGPIAIPGIGLFAEGEHDVTEQQAAVLLRKPDFALVELPALPAVHVVDEKPSEAATPEPALLDIYQEPPVSEPSPESDGAAAEPNPPFSPTI